MALFYTPQKNTKSVLAFEADILELDYQGLGVARVNGKTWFVENALPGETVRVAAFEEKRQYGKGRAVKILHVAPERCLPRCAYYQQCGGCQGQHIAVALQRRAKQNALFQRLRRLQPQGIEFMPMIVGEPWHYRRRAHFAIRGDGKHKGVVLGFRRKNSQQIVPITRCEVLEAPINDLLPKLTALFTRWSQPKLLGHLELTAADNGSALLLRQRGNLAETDRTLLQQFAEKQNLMLFVQDDERIEQLHGESPYYQLNDGLRLQFDISDFIQVNAALNQRMVDTALDWLALTKQDNVLDLFCGMGNFTLPISRQAKSAVGIEGVSAMVEKAIKNAERNNCTNVQFYRGDLDQPFIQQQWSKREFNKILLDPPRSGAAFALNALCGLGAEKILYVSCNPATLVRDAEILLNSGYQLKRTAMIDMFPHTGHLESISLFEKRQ